MNSDNLLTKDQLKQVLVHYLGAEKNSAWECPFHAENIPSLKIAESKQHAGHFYWKCHGCGVFGDGYEFIKRSDGLNDFPEQLTRAGEILGIDLVNNQKKLNPNAATQKKDKVTIDMVEPVYKELVKYTKLNHPDILEYLTTRMLNPTDCQIALKFRFVPFDDRFKIANHFEKIIPRQTLIDSGMFKETENEKGVYFLFSGQLLIPWYFNKRLHGFQGRRILEKDAEQYGKYKSTGFLPVLYIPPCTMDREKDLLLTEGAIDAVSHVICNRGRAVSIPSINTSIERLLEAGKLILKAKPKKIVFGLDGDAAGQSKRESLGNKSVQEVLTQYFIDCGFDRYRIKEIIYPDGVKDMNQIIVKQKTG